MDASISQREAAPRPDHIEIRNTTPLLPRAAFVLISLASLLGVTFTSTTLSLAWPLILWRWLAIWSLALTIGTLAWRLFYLRAKETNLDEKMVAALVASLLGRVALLRNILALLLTLSAPVPFLLPYLALPARIGIGLGYLTLAVLLVGIPRSRVVSSVAFAVAALVLGAWAWGDTFGAPWPTALRVLHLSAFSLWLGGALFNLGAAVPAGVQNANVDAVIAGALQLERFRWVVRFSLPTVILTGILMALRFGGPASAFWRSGVGLIVPLKMGLVLVLVVIFITCPLYRACSPVRGVCKLDDLDGNT